MTRAESTSHADRSHSLRSTLILESSMGSLILVWILFGTGPSPEIQQTTPGSPVDIAAFARQRTSDDQVELEWDEPRVVRRLEIVFARNAPDPSTVDIDTWVSNWPPKPAGGWTKSDTPW